jgi:hypothetical protein
MVTFHSWAGFEAAKRLAPDDLESPVELVLVDDGSKHHQTIDVLNPVLPHNLSPLEEFEVDVLTRR